MEPSMKKPYIGYPASWIYTGITGVRARAYDKRIEDAQFCNKEYVPLIVKPRNISKKPKIMKN